MAFELLHTERCFSHFNFFFLKEYWIENENNKTEEQLLDDFIDNRAFVTSCSLSEKIKKVSDLPDNKVKSVTNEIFHGPFAIKHLNVSNFKKYIGNQLAEVLNTFKLENSQYVDWENHNENVVQSFELIEKYNIENDTLFYLSKDHLNKVQIAPFDYYEYYLLFVVINKQRNRLISLGYGSD